jgi:hypothetical protein
MRFTVYGDRLLKQEKPASEREGDPTEMAVGARGVPCAIAAGERIGRKVAGVYFGTKEMMAGKMARVDCHTGHM